MLCTISIWLHHAMIPFYNIKAVYHYYQKTPEIQKMSYTNKRLFQLRDYQQIVTLRCCQFREAWKDPSTGLKKIKFQTNQTRIKTRSVKRQR